jgi:hypothetical protein
MTAKQAKTAFLVAALVTVCVTGLLAYLFPYAPDPEAKVVWYKRVPAFAAMLGFVGCMVMVPLVKTFSKKVLIRPEGYYTPLEARLATLQGAPPGKSLADPSAPSEAGAEPGEAAAKPPPAKASPRKKNKKKGGRRG